MRERPIIFSGPMVRAILDGRKTQTRRVLKPQPKHAADTWHGDATECFTDGRCPACEPPYAPGDRLWVRETWAHDAPDLETCRRAYEDAVGGLGYGPYYRATEVAPRTLKWRPSIHMPRWASRITLEATAVRVQRVQEIDFDDCRAEGADPAYQERVSTFCTDQDCDGRHYGEKWHFRRLWNSLHAKPGRRWEDNPWVAAISFRRLP